MKKQPKHESMTVQEFSQYMKEQIEQLVEMDIERAKEYVFKLDPNIGIRVIIEKIEQSKEDNLENNFLDKS